MTLSSWISPKTARGLPSNIHGNGFFALENIAKGEFIALKAGHIIDRQTLDENRAIINHSEMQIADDFWLAPLSTAELNMSMLYLNHSCEPNLIVQGQIAHVAFRDIAKGQEITADYGISFDDPGFRLECNCGLPTCRKIITGKDWQLPELQLKYGHNFPWFILRKIHQP